MSRLLSLGLFSLALLTQASCIIMRNNALMSKMMTQFQGKDQPVESSDREDVILLMQNVLCRNFPTVPCEYVTGDPALRRLIEKSIRQINIKKASIDRSTAAPFPVDSEDLSNFLQLREPKPKKQKKRKPPKMKNRWSHEREASATRKKIRKFYPHKVKYRDSDEKLSVEADPKPAKRFGYEEDSGAPPVWRIDYTKHGEPQLPGYQDSEDALRGKIIEGPGVALDEHLLDHAVRKDVLHPDVYIKKNFVRKKSRRNHGGFNEYR